MSDEIKGLEKKRVDKLDWRKYHSKRIKKEIAASGQPLETSPDDEPLKEACLVFDVHAHPAIKMNIPVIHLTIAGVRPMGYRMPTSHRTSFNRLYDGGVRVLPSGVVTSEGGFIRDLRLSSSYGAFLKARGVVNRKTSFEQTEEEFKNVKEKVERYNRSWWRRVTNKYWRPSNPLPEVTVAQNVKAVEDAVREGKIAIIQSIEGAHGLEGERVRDLWRNKLGDNAPYEDVPRDARDEVIENLETLAGMGLAIIGLGHYYPNVVTATTFSYPQSIAKLVRGKRWKWAWRDGNLGLTDFGREFIEKALDLDIILDVAHVAPVARQQIYDIVKAHPKDKPVIASHVGAYALNPDPYNVTDEEIRTIRDLGGLVGVMFSNYWLVGHDGSDLGINWLSQTIHHIKRVGGIETVGLGTDFDGFSDPPDDLVDASEMPRLALRLAADGMSFDEIQMVMGGNAWRVLQKGWH